MSYLKFPKELILVISICSLYMFSCNSDGDDPAPVQDDTIIEQDDPQADLTVQLSESDWKSATVTREGSDVTVDYIDLVLKFNGDGTYTAANGYVAWESSGSWKFPDDETVNQILINNDILMDIILEDNVLTLSFQLEEDVFGRTKTAISDYTFVFNR